MGIIRFIDRLNEWTGQVFSLVILLITGLASYEVVCRYVLNSPTTWAWEINSQLMCLMGALAGGYALLHKAHVSMDILYSRLSPRAQALMDIITCPLFFLFVGALIWFGAKEALRAYTVHQRMISQFASPLWPIKTIIPLGGVLLFLQGLAKLVRDIETLTGRGEG
ncbi:MAG: TRAP transporter small permease subunit [Thermodesulfobacteriota bacterium]